MPSGWLRRTQVYYVADRRAPPLPPNHHVEPAEYESNAPLPSRNTTATAPNAAIVTNAISRRWIRLDFPSTGIEASVVKNLKTYDRIAAALDLHDTAVLPMSFPPSASLSPCPLFMLKVGR